MEVSFEKFMSFFFFFEFSRCFFSYPSITLQSFRFGPEIGYVASCALEVLKGVSNKTIVGSAEEGA